MKEIKKNPNDHNLAMYRFLININKVGTSIRATESIRCGIEVLAGNGLMEDFCVLPRLMRDNLVYENWEGPHNILSL